jgi:hypothetical protein
MQFSRFSTLWESEIRINLKIDADDLNGSRRRFCVRGKIYHIHQEEGRQYGGKSECVYGVCTVEHKIEIETNLTHCTSHQT